MLYDFAPIVYVFDGWLLIISVLAALACSAGVTWLSCHAELRENPANLMRPKTPKAGKRILLEYIPFVWNRLSFLHKVSIRNIVRYKKRLFMMLLGVGGCTALIVAGLGLRDSISTVVDDQFRGAHALSDRRHVRLAHGRGAAAGLPRKICGRDDAVHLCARRGL